MDNNELIKYLSFENEIHKDPNSEPFIILASNETWHPIESGRSGVHKEIISFRSFMVSVDSKELALNALKYSDMYFDGMGHFEENESGKKKYITGESWEHFEGLMVEPLYIYRYWEGLGLSVYEPSQRMLHYLKLLNPDNNNVWIDPYNKQEVIRILKCEDSSDYVNHTLKKIEIKIDYLKDYLAARESGLIITKYAIRAFLFDTPEQIPLKSEDKEIINGTLSFISSVDNPIMSLISEGKLLGQSELQQIFWIDPYSEPRRWDAQNTSEFKGNVVFTLNNGERKTYNTKAGHGDDYFKLISFNPRIMSIFMNTLHYDYEEYSRETLGLIFPNGESLHAAINSTGQIQAWWGQIAKLRREYQEQIAQFSEPWLEKLNSEHDYIRTTIHGNFPQTKPVKQSLQNLKSEINTYFITKFNESFFNQESSVNDLKKVYEPYETDYHQLLDIMVQIDKWLFSEKRPNKIIEHYNLANEIDDINNLSKIKSLVALKLLIKKYFGNDDAENKTKILKLIKDLRICKAHFKDLSKILDQYALVGNTPQKSYKIIINELEGFLEWLSDLCQKEVFR
jgi:hypothetical protein